MRAQAPGVELVSLHHSRETLQSQPATYLDLKHVLSSLCSHYHLQQPASRRETEGNAASHRSSAGRALGMLVIGRVGTKLTVGRQEKIMRRTNVIHDTIS